MKVLITGGAGYIGNVLVEYLLKNSEKKITYRFSADLGGSTVSDVKNPFYVEDVQVTVLDNLMYKQTCLLEYCNNPNFKFVYGDVRDKKLVKKLVSDADVIIPLACIVGMPACKKDEQSAIQVNQEAIEYLAEITTDQQKIIYPTTNSGYGLGIVKDGEVSECDENTPLNPISLYGVTKVNAENCLLKRGNAVVLRLATVFGLSPKMRLDLLVNDFTYRAFTDKFVVLFEKHFKRNFIHVRDIARTFIFCINNFDQMKGQPYNVGLSSANLSKEELCDKIKQHIPEFCVMSSEINKDPDQRNYIVSNKKLESLGWSPKFDLDFGINELMQGYEIVARNNKLFTNL